MRRLIRRAMWLVPAIIAVSTIPAEAQGNWQPGDFGSLRFRFGLFEPRADSQYWDEKFLDFTGSPESFRDFTFGIDYVWRIGKNSGLVFGGSFYQGRATQSYRDWVDSSGRDISHTTTLSTWDLYAAYQYRFGKRTWSVRPYAGIGGGFVNWRLQESGDFIDFGDDDLPIVYADFRASGWTYEAFLMGGLEVPIGFRWSFLAEGRWKQSDDVLGDDFSGFGDIDLSGAEFTAGFSWNF